MTRVEIINKLEVFKGLLNTWQILDSDSPQIPTVRTQINKSKSFVQSVVYKTGSLKRFDIGPPPAVGGFMMRNVNPFDVIFDPPYRLDTISPLIDSIDEAIGVIEADESFSIEPEIDSKKSEMLDVKNSKKVFLVHGHNNEIKETVARFLEKIELHPIILHEQVNKGQTIIEKFEEHSDVPFAIVLMTPDDVGNSISKKENLSFRARQNVIFELGYFFGKLGRQNVCALISGDIERPSDYDGIIYIGFDSEGWKLLLAKELKQAGLDFDLNKIF